MEIVAGPDASSLEIALDPGELALYVRYGLLPVQIAGIDATALSTNFRLPLLFSVDPGSRMGILKLDVPRVLDVEAATEQWPLLVVELREALVTAREQRGVSYSVAATPAHLRV